MRRKEVIGLSLLSVIALSMISVGVFSAKKPVVVHGYTNGDAATYYNSIDPNATPTALLASLRTLNNNKRLYLPGYNGMRSYFSTTDPGSSSSQVRSFYSGKSSSYSNMNREHVWPFSKLVINSGDRGVNDIEKDMHMIRPTLTSENSSRGNSFFVEGKKDSSAGWDPGMETWGDATYRGDAARIIFYCVIADNGLSLVDKESDYNSNHTMGKLSDLLKWNLQYSVQERENVRNEQVEKLQGNRNPFIDHPEYACKIWGNTNATTKSICGGGSSDTSGIAIRNGLDSSEMPLINEKALTDEVTLLPFYNGTLVNETSKVTWSLIQYSNSAAYTGKAVNLETFNTTGIRLTVNEDVSFGVKLQYFDGTQARIKFKFGNGSEDSGKKSKPKKGCGGSIVTTSAILSSLSVLGIGLLLIKRKHLGK